MTIARFLLITPPSQNLTQLDPHQKSVFPFLHLLDLDGNSLKDIHPPVHVEASARGTISRRRTAIIIALQLRTVWEHLYGRQGGMEVSRKYISALPSAWPGMAVHMCASHTAKQPFCCHLVSLAPSLPINLIPAQNTRLSTGSAAPRLSHSCRGLIEVQS